MKLTKEIISVMKYHGFMTSTSEPEIFLKHYDTVEELGDAGFIEDRGALDVLRTIFNEDGVNMLGETKEEDVVETTVEEPVVETTVEEPTETPVEETVEEPVAETTETPVEEPVAETTETPVEETTETLTDSAPKSLEETASEETTEDKPKSKKKGKK